jgi:hypothetical protein
MKMFCNRNKLLHKKGWIYMWGWKPTLWDFIILILATITSTIVCFPCWLLQKIGIKAKRYAKFLSKTGLEDFSFFVIKEYDN